MASPKRILRHKVVRIDAHGEHSAYDEVAGEEPLEIRVDGVPVAITMRTPGHDFDLALGFCLSEGIIESHAELRTIDYCAGPGRPTNYNVVNIRRRNAARIDERLRRNVYTTSSCGVCGTTSIDALRKQVDEMHADRARVRASVVASLPDRLRAEQPLFGRTGGMHAAGLALADGTIRCVREDVGRHNAVDKVMGWGSRTAGLPLSGHVLVVSGRVAFEIVQKAAIAGVPIIVAVSAPTSLAVDLAESVGITLIGFVRRGTMNVYSGAERVDADFE